MFAQNNPSDYFLASTSKDVTNIQWRYKVYKLRSAVDKNWYSQCDKMLKTIKESFNIVYYGNTDKVCHVDTVTSLQDAWSVISKDRYDMQSFHATFGHSRKKQNYEVWQNNQLVVQVTYDR